MLPPRRKLPPLNAVRTFEAAARHVSFSKAAEELHVTHGAVSRQVAILEDWFGVQLFRRTGSGVTLTDPGATYYREVSELLDRLALASKHVNLRSSATALRVNAPPTFTMRWLIRRMNSFQRRSPEVELRLTTAVGPISATETGFDIGIRGDAGQVDSGWRAHRFMTEIIAPVCRVDLLQTVPLRTHHDLSRCRLLTYLTEPYDWQQWFSAVGSTPSADQATLRFEQMYFALQAVQDGMGIGLFPLFLVMDELVAGSLCVPFGELGVRQRAYRCFYRPEHDSWQAVSDFCDWLSAEGEETERALLAWTRSMNWNVAIVSN
jgi:LysR family transcriptional regulator, glycine cleavage system transcriptional activator